jgi:ascorbate-specific PTS system EIIC-type component UlaA
MGSLLEPLLGVPSRPLRGLGAWRLACVGGVLRGVIGYLVDSASSHMLVSKIKPCKSKYKQLYGETANGSLNQLSFI